MSHPIIDTDTQSLETIAATYPTQQELIAATSVYHTTVSPLIDSKNEGDTHKNIFVVAYKETELYLTIEAMDKLATLYVDNKELLSVLDKAQKTKTVPVAKAANGSGCAYLGRDPN